MSKIAEKRTDEIVGEFHDGDYTDHSRHNTQWVAFKQGYDQAMQDFLEKACDYLKRNYPDVFDTYTENGYNEIEKFKEYLKL